MFKQLGLLDVGWMIDLNHGNGNYRLVIQCKMLFIGVHCQEYLKIA
jgi:hypothetical protein